MYSFIIPNAKNTCYMDTIIVSLFLFYPELDKSSKNNLFNKDVGTAKQKYLQSYIFENIVTNIKKNLNVEKNVIKELRNICSFLGWPTKQSLGLAKRLLETEKQSLGVAKQHLGIAKQHLGIAKQHLDTEKQTLGLAKQLFELKNSQEDATEFYTFLANQLEMEQIFIQRFTITGALPSNSDKGSIEKIPFIPLHIYENFASVEKMFFKWKHDNIISTKRRLVGSYENIKGLNNFYIKNKPKIIPFYIHRIKNNSKINYNIDIQQIIYPFNNCEANEINYKSNDGWIIHSIICHSSDKINKGHYNSYIYDKNNNIWYLFDDIKIPSICVIDINQQEIKEYIQQNSYMLFYIK